MLGVGTEMRMGMGMEMGSSSAQIRYQCGVKSPRSDGVKLGTVPHCFCQLNHNLQR